MTSTMRASAREMRHMVGRYLHARRCPGFAVNAVRDGIMAAQAEGYDAVTQMERIRDGYADALTRFAVADEGDARVLDGRGSPAPLLVPALVDELALALVEGRGRVTVRNVPGIRMLTALTDYAAMRGVSFACAELGEDAAVLEVRAVDATPVGDAAAAAGPAMRRILLEGYAMDAEQFWRLFRESNEALTPDSELSRRHAGSQLYDENGNLIGEIGEETYLHLRSESGGATAAVLA